MIALLGEFADGGENGKLVASLVDAQFIAKRIGNGGVLQELAVELLQVACVVGSRGKLAVKAWGEAEQFDPGIQQFAGQYPVRLGRRGLPRVGERYLISRAALRNRGIPCGNGLLKGVVINRYR